MKNIFKVIACLSLVSVFLVSCSKGPRVADGSLVSVEYTGFYKGTKEQFDTNVGKNPLNIIVGTNQVLPAFEKKLIGMTEGAKKKISLKAEEAYGPVDEKKVVTMPKDDRFKGLDIKEGQFITANQRGADGRPVQIPVKVTKITDKEITLDYNHPLAGKDLTYDVKVLKVQSADEVAKLRAAAQQQAQAAAQEQAKK